MIALKIPEFLRRWLLVRAMNTIADRPADYVIGTRADPVLSRWHVVGPGRFFGLYVHVIYKADPAPPHDHPYVSASVILRGGYIEHVGDRIRFRGARDVILRGATEAHRLEPYRGGFSISLFIVGPRVRVWGFECRDGWKPYTEAAVVVDGQSQIREEC